MIWRPFIGQMVRLRYRKGLNAHHDLTGVVEIASRGRGPINSAVRLENGNVVVVPRGNLFEVKLHAEHVKREVGG